MSNEITVVDLGDGTDAFNHPWIKEQIARRKQEIKQENEIKQKEIAETQSFVLYVLSGMLVLYAILYITCVGALDYVSAPQIVKNIVHIALAIISIVLLGIEIWIIKRNWITISLSASILMQVCVVLVLVSNLLD